MRSNQLFISGCIFHVFSNSYFPHQQTSEDWDCYQSGRVQNLTYIIICHYGWWSINTWTTIEPSFHHEIITISKFRLICKHLWITTVKRKWRFVNSVYFYLKYRYSEEGCSWVLNSDVSRSFLWNTDFYILQIVTKESLNQVRTKVEEYREVYDSIVAEDKMLDRAFKRDFSDVPLSIADQLYKLFKRRPR